MVYLPTFGSKQCRFSRLPQLHEAQECSMPTIDQRTGWFLDISYLKKSWVKVLPNLRNIERSWMLGSKQTKNPLLMADIMHRLGCIYSLERWRILGCPKLTLNPQMKLVEALLCIHIYACTHKWWQSPTRNLWCVGLLFFLPHRNDTWEHSNKSNDHFCRYH